MSGLTRRRFLAAGAASSVLLRVPLLGETGTRLADDPMRPQFHLLPAKNWMNDPNGPIYWNGRYHMFFQYNPLAATWGDMSWNHAVSEDMVHWKLLPVAMTPTPGGDDAYGCFSGSAIAVGKRVYAVYTGTVKSGPELATIHADGVQESQCLAWSEDAALIHWTKAEKPVIPLPPQGMAITGFRDPSVWKQGEWYYMTVGAGEAKVGGCVLLYRSRDLHSWEYQHKLTSGAWTGRWTPNPCDDGEMWECPELFPLGSEHVLIYSTLGKVYWQSGALDAATMLFHPRKSGLLDLDAFYAPKTQLDAHGQRILWGWIQERRSEAAMRAAGWSGMMSLPRVLTLDSDGTLRMSIAEPVKRLRGASLAAQQRGASTVKTLPRATGEVLCEGARGKPLDVRLRRGEVELLHVRYAPETHSFHVGEDVTALQPDDVPSVHAYVDGSVIEVLLSGRIGVTKRFYYEAATAPDVAVVAEGAVRFEAWMMQSITNDRMTDSA